MSLTEFFNSGSYQVKGTIRNNKVVAINKEGVRCITSSSKIICYPWLDIEEYYKVENMMYTIGSILFETMHSCKVLKFNHNGLLVVDSKYKVSDGSSGKKVFAMLE